VDVATLRSTAVARVVFTVAGRELARRAAPLYVGLGVTAAVLFGGNGMKARNVIGIMHASPWWRGGLWLAWVAAARPLVQAAFSPRELFFLRSLPVARVTLIAPHLALAWLAQLPWLILHARGAGTMAALGATSAATTLALAACWPPRRLLGLVAAVATLVAVSLPSWHAEAAATAVLAVLVMGSEAFAAVPERAARDWRLPLPHSPSLALAMTHLLGLAREHRLPLLRAMLFTTAAAGAAWLGAANNDLSPASAGSLATGLAAFVAALGAGGAALFLLDVERRARWVWTTTGTTAATRVWALGAATALVGAALAAWHAALSGYALGLSAFAVAAQILAGAGVGALAGRLARPRGETKPGSDALRIAALGLGSAMLAGLLGRWAGPLLFTAGLGATLGSVPREDPEVNR